MNDLIEITFGVVLALRAALLMIHNHRYVALRKSGTWISTNSRASDPGRLSLSDSMLRSLRPDWYTGGLDPFAWIDARIGGRAMARFQVADQLLRGDSRAALVVSVDPLLIAAYTDELDCIALLRFPSRVARIRSLQVGQRLLTVNSYWGPSQPFAADLENGPTSYRRYHNFQPLVADFLTADLPGLAGRTVQIKEAEWQRTAELAQRYLARFGTAARDGRPWHCTQAAPVARPGS